MPPLVTQLFAMGSVCVSMMYIVQEMQDSFELLLRKWSPVYLGCNSFLSSSWPPCSHHLLKMSVSFPSSLLLFQNTWERQELPGTPSCQELHKQGAEESPAQVQAGTATGLTRHNTLHQSPQAAMQRLMWQIFTLLPSPCSLGWPCIS